MKAWRLRADGTFGLEEVPEPVAGPGEFLLDVHAAGVCHSDVGIIDGPGRSWVSHLPITLGHEVAGVVSSVGPDPKTNIAVGDRVALVGTDLTNSPGVSRDGGYAYQAIGIADERSFLPIPARTSFEQAAVATDSGMTSYHAVIAVGGVTSGSRVGIVGLGGLGAVAARIAVLAGAEVHAAEPRDEVREAAVDALGIAGASRDVLDFAGLDLDVVIDFAGFGTTTAGAVEVVAPGGRVVQVGLGSVESTINTSSLVTKQVTLVGSLGGDKSDVAAVLDLIATGKLTPALTPITFEEIGEGIDRLRAGQVTGRLVAHLRD
jgi:D-arabinose 1-dehydrogenase-like Zn-dependent alcohol dehydrogenase